MYGMSERKNAPVSTAELERRWAKVREAMTAAKLDVLLMQNVNDHIGGYVRYFTDVPASNGYPSAVVFPVDDLMTVVSHGPFDMDLSSANGIIEMLRGVKRRLGTPSFTSVNYNNAYDPELIELALEPYARGTIGVLGLAQVSYALFDHVKKRFPQATFVDFSDEVDAIKVIKSPEEQEMIRRTAEIQDGAIQAAFDAIRPGMRDREVAAVAQEYCHVRGTESGIWLCASYPIGEPSFFGGWHSGNRIIREGDAFAQLVETNGPGGMYAEVGRTCVLGKAPAAMLDDFEFALEARRFTLDLLKPGTPCADVWNEYNAFMRRNGREEERRLYCHGQGYDLVERPLVRKDEPMTIEAGMNLAVHPTFFGHGVFSWVCDNYLIGGNGPEARLHKFPERVVELG